MFDKADKAQASAGTLHLATDESKPLLLNRSSRDPLNRDLEGSGVDGTNEKDEDQPSDDSVERLVYGNDYVQRRRAEKEQARNEASLAAEAQQEMDAMLKAQMNVETLTAEQQELMRAYMESQFKGEEVRNPISILSKVAAIKGKDYVTYTPD